MTGMITNVDPLSRLPAEIVLRICLDLSPPTLASLARASRQWHHFIDKTHREVIYSAQFDCTPGQNLSCRRNDASFAKYYSRTQSWKELCKRKFALQKNWASRQPLTMESHIQVGETPVWRFRPDFDNRTIMSTSQRGGFFVTDMDGGGLIWRLSEAEVRPYAHLEYSCGVAVWDREGNGLEVWKTDEAQRGRFTQVAVIPHNCEIRGFHLDFPTLCVVSSNGQGFVYDLSTLPEEPFLQTKLSICEDAIGHLHQNHEAVMFSMGQLGYHLFSKESDRVIGVLHPKDATRVYHIEHEKQEKHSIAASELALIKPFPPRIPRRNRLIPIEISDGPHPNPRTRRGLLEDDWGAGLLFDKAMVGISRAGRLFVCSDWKTAIRSPETFTEMTAIIECESDVMQFDMGGWLSMQDHRVMFEIDDRVYLITLGPDFLPRTGRDQPASHAASLSAGPQLKIPVSYMTLHEDNLMYTYATLTRRHESHEPGGHGHQWLRAPFAYFATKLIRVLSLAPGVEGETAQEDDIPAALD